jgi:hypothetical protein
VEGLNPVVVGVVGDLEDFIDAIEDGFGGLAGGAGLRDVSRVLIDHSNFVGVAAGCWVR